MIDAARRQKTENKLNQRKKLAKHFGWNGGLLYKRQREKITESTGYMRDGNVSHFVCCGGGIKTKTKNDHASYRCKGGYGKARHYSTNEQRQLDDFNEQVKEI